MVRSFVRYLLPSLCLALWMGCRFVAPVPEMDVNHRIELQPPTQVQAPTLKDPKKFSFLFFADIQVDNRLNEDVRLPVLKALQDYLAKHPVDFMISGGDNTENGTRQEYKYIDTQLAQLKVPIYWCLGNHDLFGDGWKYWQELYGTSIRMLKVANTSIYILDNASGTIGLNQRQWLEKKLSQDSSEHRIVVMHFPLYSGNHFELDGQAHFREAYTLSTLFEQYQVKYVLAGHTHIYRKAEINGVQHYTVSALKENSHNKMFLRFDIEGSSVKVKVIPVQLEGYIE